MRLDSLRAVRSDLSQEWSVAAPWVGGLSCPNYLRCPRFRYSVLDSWAKADRFTYLLVNPPRQQSKVTLILLTKQTSSQQQTCQILYW